MTLAGVPAGPGDPPRIAFVCRGSLRDGLGHLTRSAAVAQRLVRLGVAAEMFVIGDDNATGVLADLQVPHEVVRDEGAILGAVAEYAPQVVVFDLIELPDPVFTELAEHRATTSLSPVFDHLKEVDVSYSRTRYEPDPELRAHPDRHRRGLAFTVVPPHVRPISHSDYVSVLYEDPLSVGISMGGADAPNKTLDVLEQLRTTSTGCLFWVMLGEGYAHSYEELVDTIRRDRRHEIVLAKTTRSMWTVLDRCSLVILAGGVTTYEATYAGMPSINLVHSQDHRFLLRELEEGGAVACVDGSDEPASWGAKLRTALDEFERDRDHLFRMHRRARNLIDGRGAERIASELAALANERVVTP